MPPLIPCINADAPTAPTGAGGLTFTGSEKTGLSGGKLSLTAPSLHRVHLGGFLECVFCRCGFFCSGEGRCDCMDIYFFSISPGSRFRYEIHSSSFCIDVFFFWFRFFIHLDFFFFCFGLFIPTPTVPRHHLDFPFPVPHPRGLLVGGNKLGGGRGRGRK